VALLEVSDLRAYVFLPGATVHAVDGVDLSIEPGATLGIVGESGCGKSMTALAMIGLLPPRCRLVAGSVRFNGRELTTLRDRDLETLRGQELAMVFQDPMTSLHPMLTIGTQISEVLRRHLGLTKNQAHERAVELLNEVGIPNAASRINDYPHHFSGGMRQRVMIAMAISCEPKLLIADEPTTALDVTVQADILDLLADLQHKHAMALVLITHDMGVIAEMANEVIVMYAGQVVERAATTALFDAPQHPYTEALLGALPRLDRDDARRFRLTAIPGRPPVVVEPEARCRFADRCAYASRDDDCLSRPPELYEVMPNHWVRSAHPALLRSTESARSLHGA
jgi:peptide/nickel transport system ATP-binding protein